MITNRNLIVLLAFSFVPLINICEAVSNKMPAIYYGNQGWAMNDIQSFSSWVGKHPIVILLFTDWCNGSMYNLFNYQLKNIWDNGSIPAITWEAFKCGGSSQPGIMSLVRNHTYDTYINQFGDYLAAWLAGMDGVLGNSDDRRAYLRLAHEMNGNWYPWSIGSTPQDYVWVWHYIHDLFVNKSLDSTRLQWIWCVNNVDVGSYTAENYWVGEHYVDWMGIDGYNIGTSQSWSSWLNPNQIFDSMIARLQNLSSTKPICINEYASTSLVTGNISNITAKYDWLQQFCTYINNKQIIMTSYFNIDKETDWAIFGGVRGDSFFGNHSAYTAYRDCLQSNDWIIINSTNPRLISDEEFSGTVLNTTSTTIMVSTTTTSLTNGTTSDTVSSTLATIGPTTQTTLVTTANISINSTIVVMPTTSVITTTDSTSTAVAIIFQCGTASQNWLAMLIFMIKIFLNN
ncbi:unnamed protein product [Rotaria socialis]|uniref:GH26 domain-containing protein n=1 Tax=Rotaria socialis TaxID=392032 RepID=A0A820ZLJ5_9BILA|nr:unnamed protein product [Rotaria socialis]CAF4224046.1 unnamed protein product [Rotaria socialis]CAF4562340.1 unnamed protein product [Rotaria socialis]